MSYKPPADFALQISRGLVSNMITINKFGRNPDIDIGSEDIWGVGGTFVAPTAATTVALVSASAADASAGTGARTILVEGLNGSYAITSETVTLNGVTPVNTVNSYFFIHRITVATAGTGNTNAGNITSSWTGGGTPVGPTVLAGKGQSQFCQYQIPASYTGYLSDYGGSYNGASTSNVLLELYVKPFGGVFNLKGTVNLSGSASSFARREYAVPLKFTEKSIIKLVGVSDANNSDVVGSFDLILVAN